MLQYLGHRAGATREVEEAILIATRCFGADEGLVAKLREDSIALKLNT